MNGVVSDRGTRIIGQGTVASHFGADQIAVTPDGRHVLVHGQLGKVSIRRRDGRPLAVLGNYSLHYFSTAPLSADYFGLFSEGLKKRLAPDGDFVGMLSHGCSGDTWRRDYAKPQGERRDKISMEQYTDELLDIAVNALKGVEHRSQATLAMAESRCSFTRVARRRWCCRRSGSVALPSRRRRRRPTR